MARTCTAIDCFAAFDHRLRIALAHVGGVRERPAGRQIAVQRIVRGGLVGHHVAAALPRFRISGKISAALPSRPMEIALPSCFARSSSRERLVERRRLACRDSASPAAARCARGSHFDREHRGAGHGRGQRLRAAHAAEAAGQDPAALEIAAVMLAAQLRRRSRRCPARCPGCRYRSRSRRSSGRTSSGPWRSSSRKCSQVAQCGTRLELAISTRGASVWVRNTPTGLPDWISSVSSSFRRLQRLDDAVEALPVARGAADAAIDHQLVRVLRHVGIQVVHQHAQRRLGQPGLGAEGLAVGRADNAGVEAGSGHDDISVQVVYTSLYSTFLTGSRSIKGRAMSVAR